jgi:hypothetical protein
VHFVGLNGVDIDNTRYYGHMDSASGITVYRPTGGRIDEGRCVPLGLDTK